MLICVLLAGVGVGVVVVGGAVGENMVIGHVQLTVEYTPWVFFPTADYSGSWFNWFDQSVSRGWAGGCALLEQAGTQVKAFKAINSFDQSFTPETLKEMHIQWGNYMYCTSAHRLDIDNDKWQ